MAQPIRRPATPTVTDRVQEGVEQLQRQLGEIVDEMRARVQEAADQAAERATAAADLAVKLAYAGVGAVAYAQDAVNDRVARIRR